LTTRKWEIKPKGIVYEALENAFRYQKGDIYEVLGQLYGPSFTPYLPPLYTPPLSNPRTEKKSLKNLVNIPF
jgi:hypothetical protein